MKIEQIITELKDTAIGNLEKVNTINCLWKYCLGWSEFLFYFPIIKHHIRISKSNPCVEIMHCVSDTFSFRKTHFEELEIALEKLCLEKKILKHNDCYYYKGHLIYEL